MKMIDASGIGHFRITSDGDARDVHEIHEMLKEYNLCPRHPKAFLSAYFWKMRRVKSSLD